MRNNYISVICKYCPYTDYGEESSSTVTGCGMYISCERSCCDEALDNYNDDNDEELTMDEAF